MHLLPAVMIVLVVAAESSKRAETDGVRKEDLGASIHPYLKIIYMHNVSTNATACTHVHKHNCIYYLFTAHN